MSRIESVDVFRLIAIVGVIIIHTSPFKTDTGIASDAYKFFDVFLNQISRFAVPFFFVISGYFWGLKIRGGEDLISTTLNMGKRILTIFLAWCLIYLSPFNLGAVHDYGILGPIKVAYWTLMKNPMTLLMEGTKVHLWFLTGLLCALFLCALFVYRKRIIWLVVLSIFLYIFGVLAKAYADTPIGININFNTRNGPFFSTIFFVTGYIISGKKLNEQWLYYGLLLFCIGTIVHFVEIYMLWHMFQISPKQAYVMGTYFMGVGIALAALSNHPILRNNMLGKFGKMTLGVYAVHFIFVDLFRPFDRVSDSVVWEVGYVIMVLFLSLATTFLLSKNKRLRKIVM